MELGKQGSSETSSEENDQPEQVKEDTGSSKRSYECTFCKRGFTNAQALGGHMNIHRKDRAAKGKQITGSSVSSKANQEYKNPSYNMAPISSEPPKYYPVWEARKNYHMYYHPPGSSPSQPHGYYHGSDFLVRRSQSLSMNEQLGGANLTLQIGSTRTEDNKLNTEVSKEDEVDLELRLGHDP